MIWLHNHKETFWFQILPSKNSKGNSLEKCNYSKIPDFVKCTLPFEKFLVYLYLIMYLLQLC